MRDKGSEAGVQDPQAIGGWFDVEHEGVLCAGLGGELFLFGGLIVERIDLLEKSEDIVFVFFCKPGTTDEMDGHVCGLCLGRGEEFVLEDICKMGE